MSSVHGGRLVAKALKAAGVEVIFTLCGGHILPIYDGCLDEGIRIIDMRHEQAAVHAADAWARLTGRPGVAVVTAGPGVTDSVTGVANAFRANSPVLVIGGQGPFAQLGRGSRFDRPVPRPGPAKAALEQAVGMLGEAERPVVMAGSAVRWCNAYSALARFVADLDLPLFTNGMARGTLPPDSPQFFQHARRKAFAQTDLLILVGGEFDFRLRFGQEIAATARVIHVDLEPTVIGHNRPVDLGLVGDIGEILEAWRQGMQARFPGRRFTAWREALRAVEAEQAAFWEQGKDATDVPIHPLRLCHELARFIDERTIVIGDGGDIVAAASRVLPVYRPENWMDPGPFGCLGIGAPFAIAAQLAYPDRRVLVLFGDGAFGFNGFEFDTAVRFGLPIMGVVANDAAWSQIRRPQIEMLGEARAVATALAPTRYDRVVEALGGYGELVERPEEIRPALERMAAARRPACLNVRTRPLPPGVLSARYF
jgi:acetolactate synthase-1/2/3 large subunit